MAYDIPTAADLIARYPAFADVPVATIDTHIADASTQGVDTSWAEADYAPAIAAFAAHRMALLSIGDHGEVVGFARAGLTRIRSGNFDASFSERAVGRASGGELSATPYGRAYKSLLQKNKGGPRIVGRPLTPDDAYPGPAWPL
jgi:hypothetical protein